MAQTLVVRETDNRSNVTSSWERSSFWPGEASVSAVSFAVGDTWSPACERFVVDSWSLRVLLFESLTLLEALVAGFRVWLQVAGNVSHEPAGFGWSATAGRHPSATG